MLFLSGVGLILGEMGKIGKKGQKSLTFWHKKRVKKTCFFAVFWCFWGTPICPPVLPSQKDPPPRPAKLTLEQAVPKTPGLEHPAGYSSGGPVTLIIRVHICIPFHVSIFFEILSVAIFLTLLTCYFFPG